MSLIGCIVVPCFRLHLEMIEINLLNCVAPKAYLILKKIKGDFTLQNRAFGLFGGRGLR
ncbi:hypothetical protein SAMN05421766_102273 [Zobellia uliginosa]|uniref:Uncharacterized protein n=1 Tax=Zobellia uliginosa TaxID=143224 RepID=A0ABY1KM78_9FLAO|nr:hypothetical protein SAMN05421766_102273 [Zobellia uliginosa]